MDVVDKATRSKMMRAIRGKNTKPEMAVRRLAHSLGYRFRLHQRGLPGSPDLVFPGRRKVVFVHGCYWHRHLGCRFAYIPKSNTSFWNAKFAANVARDSEALSRLAADGWHPLVVWECEAADTEALAAQLSAHLGATE
jgi:DNA mismatch endonuclease (patch repair protein)